MFWCIFSSLFMEHQNYFWMGLLSPFLHRQFKQIHIHRQLKCIRIQLLMNVHKSRPFLIFTLTANNWKLMELHLSGVVIRIQYFSQFSLNTSRYRFSPCLIVQEPINAFQDHIATWLEFLWTACHDYAGCLPRPTFSPICTYI